MWEHILGASIVLGALLIIIIIVYYIYSFTMVKKRKAYLIQMHEAMQVGKRVIFAGGIYGKIIEIKGDVVTVEVKRGAHLDISRYSISEVLNKEEA